MLYRVRSDCNKHINKREHYALKKGQWKPKKKFDTKADADAWIKRYRLRGYTSYICKVCGWWHVGYRKIDPRSL